MRDWKAATCGALPRDGLSHPDKLHTHGSEAEAGRRRWAPGTWSACSSTARRRCSRSRWRRSRTRASSAPATRGPWRWAPRRAPCPAGARRAVALPCGYARHTRARHEACPPTIGPALGGQAGRQAALHTHGLDTPGSAGARGPWLAARQGRALRPAAMQAVGERARPSAGLLRRPAPRAGGDRPAPAREPRHAPVHLAHAQPVRARPRLPRTAAPRRVARLARAAPASPAPAMPAAWPRSGR